MLSAIRLSSSTSPPTSNPTRLPPDPSCRFLQISNPLLCSSSYDHRFRPQIVALRAVSRDGWSVKQLNNSPMLIELQNPLSRAASVG
ncbi:hypothetical protein CRG98_004902 [Punica granatum]|uniref:Uncharacterized protein n=1 Tax=Punica granatum TaxID=22663 RepID=A0A2I0L1J0_PUNGR|nr:hypothetical protein CRG98_004902 [Punica granatum]